MGRRRRDDEEGKQSEGCIRNEAASTSRLVVPMEKRFYGRFGRSWSQRRIKEGGEKMRRREVARREIQVGWWVRGVGRAKERKKAGLGREAASVSEAAEEEEEEKKGAEQM